MKSIRRVVLYAKSVWIESLKKPTLEKFNSIYNRLFQIATRDFKRWIFKHNLIFDAKEKR